MPSGRRHTQYLCVFHILAGGMDYMESLCYHPLESCGCFDPSFSHTYYRISSIKREYIKKNKKYVEKNYMNSCRTITSALRWYSLITYFSIMLRIICWKKVVCIGACSILRFIHSFRPSIIIIMKKAIHADIVCISNI